MKLGCLETWCLGGELNVRGRDKRRAESDRLVLEEGCDLCFDDDAAAKKAGRVARAVRW